MGGVVVLLVVIVLVLWVLASCIRIVPQAYAVVLERLGAYKATWSTGIHFKVPFIERVSRRVNLKEQVVDFPPSHEAMHATRAPPANQTVVEIEEIRGVKLIVKEISKEG